MWPLGFIENNGTLGADTPPGSGCSVQFGNSAGIGFETARRARAEGAKVILTGRNPNRLQQAASELGALSTAAFDASDPAALGKFFGDLPTIDR